MLVVEKVAACAHVSGLEGSAFWGCSRRADGCTCRSIFGGLCGLLGRALFLADSANGG